MATKTLKIFLILFLLFSFLCAAFFVQLNKNFSLEQDEVIFEITKGSSISRIFHDLNKEKLVSFPSIHILTFSIVNKFSTSLSLKSGEYLVTKEDNYFSLISKMHQGDVYYRKITFAEGQTSHEIIEALNSNEFFSGTISKIPEEGSLLPETYFFRKGTTRDEQIEIMQKKMQELLDDAWNKKSTNLSIKNKEELLILASIVEKETGVDSERNKIDGVFMNRLRIGMKLQSDPTVIYAKTLGKYKLERQLSKKDLRTTSPYNTYHVYGLPPTPIANPGKEAIYATANPDNTKALYFVANGQGGHSFSNTLKQHNIYVRKLRRHEQNMKNNNAK